MSEWKARLEAAHRQMAQNGMRVLGLAFHPWAHLPGPKEQATLENQLTLIGLVGMIDPPRSEVKAAVKIAKLTEDASYYLLRETVTQVIANVRTQFSTVLLDRDLITVAEESIQLLSDQLRDRQKPFALRVPPAGCCRQD